MTSCIYYDLEDISADDVRRARAHAKGGREFIASGASWPAEAAGPAPTELLNPRELAYQQQLMDWIDRLFRALQQSSSGSSVFHRRGVSLLEIARYRFFLEFAEVEQRWRVLGDLVAQCPDRIVWVTPEARRQDIANAIGRYIPAEVTLLTESRSAAVGSHVWRRARALARYIVDRAADGMAWLSDHRAGSTANPDSVVFVEYYPNSAKVLIPVAEALKRDYGTDVVWLATRRPVARLLDQFGITSLPLRRMAPNAHRIRRRFDSTARTRLRAELAALSDELLRGTGKLVGRGYLLPPMYDGLVAHLEEAAFWLDAFSEAFERLHPRHVVSTTYSSIVGRAAACAARESGAGSAYVQHGIFPDCDFYTFFCNDALLLWGDANRRTMLRNGIADEQIDVVGATIYDQLAERGRSNGLGSFPAPGEPARIAYLASRTAGMAINYSRAQHCLSVVAEAVSRIPNGHLEVKIHPGDKTGMAPALLRNCSGVTIVHEGSSQDVICRCDVAIVVSSTTGLEACMANKPLIVLKTAGVPDLGQYQSYGAALEISLDCVDAADRLADAIQSLATDRNTLAGLAEGRRRLIDDLLNGGTGNATELTARSLAELAVKRPKAQALQTADSRTSAP